jgi:hypothetical protein
VGRESKKNNKTDILRVRSKRKKKLLLKKIWICEKRLFHVFQKIIFFGALTKITDKQKDRRVDGQTA